MKSIFIVDDSDTSLLLAKEALKEHYRVLTMSSAARLFKLLEKFIPDLILLDIEMPEMDGFETIQKLKSNNYYKDVPVIFLTNYREDSIESFGFELGIVDFISKPFSTPVLVNRIKTQLDIDSLIRDRTERIKRLQNGIMTVLANVVEERDRDTVGHNDRTAAYVKILIEAMIERGIYADEIRGWDIEKVIFSSRLHDMGKIRIMDTILNKPGKLNEDEYEQMKSHTAEGVKIIERMIEQTGEVELLSNAKLYAEYHHEHWDGTGYPYGLKETDIPLHGRIMALVDAYDALISKRPYKNALADEEVAKIISGESGKQFDPKIVEVFLEVQGQFKAVKAFTNAV
ncbi:HD domain-containing phosphohydrolase [Treponema sp. R80B11-R83G3]